MTREQVSAAIVAFGESLKGTQRTTADEIVAWRAALEAAEAPAMNAASQPDHLDELANVQQLLLQIANRTPAPNASSANPFAVRRYTIADASSDAKMALMSLQRVLDAPVGHGSPSPRPVPKDAKLWADGVWRDSSGNVLGPAA